MKKSKVLSIVIPVFNEEQNVAKLHQELLSVLKKTKKRFEIIFIDDASTDHTFRELKKLKPIKIIQSRKNLGQTAALLSGIKKSEGDFIITLDGDLQNNPRAISRLIKKLNSGYDMVVGWRVKRYDSFSKKSLSRLAYFWRKFLLGSPIHDSGCGLKIMKREGLENPLPKGQIHRFLPEIFLAKGLKVAEVPIRHSPRQKGKSKYGSKRIVKGFVDTWLFWFWHKSGQKSFTRPPETT